MSNFMGNDMSNSLLTNCAWYSFFVKQQWLSNQEKNLLSIIVCRFETLLPACYQAPVFHGSRWKIRNSYQIYFRKWIFNSKEFFIVFKDHRSYFQGKTGTFSALAPCMVIKWVNIPCLRESARSSPYAERAFGNIFKIGNDKSHQVSGHGKTLFEVVPNILG